MLGRLNDDTLLYVHLIPLLSHICGLARRATIREGRSHAVLVLSLPNERDRRFLGPTNEPNCQAHYQYRPQLSVIAEYWSFPLSRHFTLRRRIAIIAAVANSKIPMTIRVYILIFRLEKQGACSQLRCHVGFGHSRSQCHFHDRRSCLNFAHCGKSSPHMVQYLFELASVA